MSHTQVSLLGAFNEEDTQFESLCQRRLYFLFRMEKVRGSSLSIRGFRFQRYAVRVSLSESQMNVLS